MLCVRWVFIALPRLFWLWQVGATLLLWCLGFPYIAVALPAMDSRCVGFGSCGLALEHRLSSCGIPGVKLPACGSSRTQWSNLHPCTGRTFKEKPLHGLYCPAFFLFFWYAYVLIHSNMKSLKCSTLKKLLKYHKQKPRCLFKYLRTVQVQSCSVSTFRLLGLSYFMGWINIWCLSM